MFTYINYYSRYKDLELDSEVVSVQVMDANVSILSSRRKRPAVGRVCDGVDWPEVALHHAELLLEDLVKEHGLKLARSRGGSRHLHSKTNTIKILRLCNVLPKQSVCIHIHRKVLRSRRKDPHNVLDLFSIIAVSSNIISRMIGHIKEYQ